jgi:hypothetical protein
VLPLLLRDKLGISNGGPKCVRIRIVSARKGLAVIELSGSGVSAEARPCSKNCGEVSE